MAQLKEGSVIKKSTGDEVIATINDIPNVPTKTSELENNSGFITSSAIPTSLPANGGNADTVGGFTVAKSVPANADFSNTTYSVISTAEIDAGVSATSRSISGARVKHMLDKTKPVLSKVKPTNGSPIWFEEI